MFEVDAAQAAELFETPDGALCVIVTGRPEYEQRFKREQRKATP